MNEIAELTLRQQQVLAELISFIKKVGYPPTRQELAKKLNIKHYSAVNDHLRAIEKKGFITIAAGISRGIVIL